MKVQKTETGEIVLIDETDDVYGYLDEEQAKEVLRGLWSFVAPRFRFVCTAHDQDLVGRPMWFVEEDATEWSADTSEMGCPRSEVDECSASWKVELV